jgi:hypothetical protein
VRIHQCATDSNREKLTACDTIMLRRSLLSAAALLSVCASRSSRCSALPRLPDLTSASCYSACVALSAASSAQTTFVAPPSAASLLSPECAQSLDQHFPGSVPLHDFVMQLDDAMRHKHGWTREVWVSWDSVCVQPLLLSRFLCLASCACGLRFYSTFSRLCTLD